MRVRAKTNINRSNGWVFTGTEFDIRKDELPELTGLVEVMGEPVSPVASTAEPGISSEGTESPAEVKPVRNSRKRKTETV